MVKARGCVVVKVMVGPLITTRVKDRIVEVREV